MTATARARLAEIFAVYAEGLLTRRELMPKVLKVFPLDAETEAFWQLLPYVLRREIHDYALADGPKFQFSGRYDDPDEQQHEAAVFAWVKARIAADNAPRS